MPDIFDENGLQIKTAAETRADLVAGFQDIYGNDINVDQNSPDGQIIGIVTQMATDLREYLASINTSFDPDNVNGVVQDQRYAINNIERQGGTYTVQPIDIVVDRTVTLSGLDDDFENPDGVGYTIADDAGNEWILIDTVTLTAGTDTVNFRAREVGAVTATVGTIQNFVTIVLGVVSVNNSSGVLEVGQDEETDPEFRIRRQRSVAIASTGYLNGIEAALLNVDGVTGVKVYENITNAVDSDGIPAHGIWCIVEAGANTDIAQVIFSRKTAGAAMKGDVSVNITTDTGAVFTAKFDRPEAQDLYIRFDIQKTNTSAVFDQAAIKSSMVAALNYGIGGYAETSSLTGVALTAIIENGGGGVPVNMEVSDDDVSWVDYIEPTAKDYQFVVDDTRITITEL
jgi:uncharacterized phage protein gp47/JayE